MSIRRHLRLLDKLMLLAACGIAAALFLSVGWLAIAPIDPRGAVSLLTHRNPIVMVLEAVALAAITAFLATLIAGAKLPDVGVFAVGLGLTLASMRGGTATYLLITIANGDRNAERMLAGKLAGESLIWSALIFVGMLVSGLTTRYLRDQRAAFGDSSLAPSANPGPVQLEELAVSECPVVNRRLGTGQESDQTMATRLGGLKTTLVTAVVALFAFCLLVSGRLPRAIMHGQVLFAVFSSFYLGVWISKQWFACRTAFWSLLAVPLVAVLGYVWAVSASSSGHAYAGLANVPMSDFLRALPITFVAAGTMGVLFARWTLGDSPPSPVAVLVGGSTGLLKHGSRPHGPASKPKKSDRKGL
ncbi:MAG: hypothetical protein GXP29_07370 [Planctomycetes bacterium]|nr:hypothetical protein [Planctomycetota bacterium]